MGLTVISDRDAVLNMSIHKCPQSTKAPAPTIQLTVMVPVYNAGAYLQRCLDSLAAQNVDGIEFICVNDGSTDSSSGMLETQAACDSRFRVIHQENGGYGKAMNTALDAARGTYVGIVEPDDWVEANMFSHLLHLAHETGADIVKANYCIERSSSCRANEKFHGIEEGCCAPPTKLPEYLQGSPSIWSAIYKRDWLNSSGIRFSETPGAAFQDLGFCIRTWLAARSLAITHAAPYHYWEDNPSGSSRKMEEGAWASFREFSLLADDFSKIPKESSTVRSLLVLRILATLRADYRSRIQETSKSFLLKYSHLLNEYFPIETLDQNTFTKNEWHDIQLLYQAPLTFPRKSKTRANLLQKLCSCRTEANHHAIRFLGLTFFIQRKRAFSRKPTGYQQAQRPFSHSEEARGGAPVPGTEASEAPLISVIIPVYNAADTLERCLSSILTSKVKSLEIICVNDGSKDSSGSILEEWSKRHACLKVISQANSGVSAARNAALKLITGKYTVFVDADDAVTPDYLANLLNAAHQYNADLIVCGYQHHLGQGETITNTPDFNFISNLSPLELMGLPASVCSHLYATRVIQQSNAECAQFPLGIRYGEDTAFHFSLFARCRRVAQISENGYHIYYTDASSNSRAASIVLDMIQATAWLAEQYRQQGNPPGCRECLLLYAAHTMRRIHSLARHQDQAQAAADMRAILRAENYAMEELLSIPSKYSQILKSILAGGSGQSLSYHFKRFKKWLRRK